MKSRCQWFVLASVLAAAFSLIALQARWGWKDTRLRHAVSDAKYPPITAWIQPRTVATYEDVDGDYWFLYARQMLTEGRWRIHWTTLDNTPYGRGVFWSSSYSWWMIFLAKVRALLLGGIALDHLAWAGDFGEAILHAIFITGFVVMFWRRAGMARTIVGALLLATLEPIASDLAFARPDHHGLHDGIVLAGLGCMACAFWPDEKRRRAWIVASAFFCAMGMWVGATGQFFILGATALGGCVWVFVCPKGVAADEFAALWRMWGRAGGAFTLAFYALEYAPGPWPFRLEVNHPLFSLAWIGLGEFTARFQAGRAAGRWITPGLLAAGIALVQLPITILALPAGLYAPRDPHIAALLRFGSETTPVMQTSPALKAAFFSMLAIVLAGFLGARAAFRSGKLTPVAVVPLVTALVLLMFAAMQVRWAGLSAVTVLVAWVVPVPPWRFHWLRPVAALAAFASAGVSFSALRTGAADSEYSYADADWHAVRDLGLFLRRRGTQPRMRILTDCSNANYVWLHDFADAELVGSPYWECLAGLSDSDDFWLCTDDAVARTICQRRGITHVLLKARPNSVMNYALMPKGAPDAAVIHRMFIYRLGGPQPSPPAWLEPVALPEGFALKTVTATRLYRVVP
jgi:hypothetical protein